MARDDADLLQRWRDGDMQAGEILFERYYEPVARFFRNKVSSDIADLIQETFTRCVEGRDRLQRGHRFGRFIFSVAHNVLCAHLRDKYKGDQPVDLDQMSMEDLAPGPSSLLARRREQRLLLEALRRIPVRDQVLLELRYWEHLRTSDIAEIVDLPHATVRTRLARARELLDDAMASLARSPAELENTLANFDEWARQCRELEVASSPLEAQVDTVS